jgi:hypothetical protein
LGLLWFLQAAVEAVVKISKIGETVEGLTPEADSTEPKCLRILPLKGMPAW